MAVSGLEVHGVIFPAVVLPPCSTHGHFLAGAGVLRTTTPQPWTPHHDDGTENFSEQPRVETWEGFLKFAVVGVYLQVDEAVLTLETKWAGWYAVHRLASDAAFFRDVVTGEFEKFTRVTMILPISGDEYARTVTENCVAYLKATGAYTAAEAAAVDKFEDIFRLHFFSPGESVLFTHSMAGILTVTFSRDSSVPESGGVAIENRPLCEAVLESIIGEHGDSPAAKLSLATRVADLLRPMRQGEWYGPGDTHRIR